MKPIKKFNRFELKYLLTREEAERVKKELAHYMKKDPYGKDGYYGLRSLYYDSEDFRFYWEKVEGIKFRRKLRIRHYDDGKPLTDDSIVYLEIKQRIDKVTQKRRLPLMYEDARKFCEEGIIPPHEPQDKLVIDEMDSMIKMYSLKPSIITQYNREAWVGHDYDVGLRVTFDTDIQYQRDSLDLADHDPDGFLISPDKVVMEVKTNERLPYWVTEFISRLNIRLIRVSKYCQGLETSTVVPESFYHLNT